MHDSLLLIDLFKPMNITVKILNYLVTPTEQLGLNASEFWD